MSDSPSDECNDNANDNVYGAAVVDSHRNYCLMKENSVPTLRPSQLTWQAATISTLNIATYYCYHTKERTS